MFPLKKLMVLLGVVVCAQLLSSAAVAGQADRSENTTITEKHNRPVYVDTRVLDPKFRQRVKDPKKLREMYRLKEPLLVPYKITTADNSFYVSEKTAVFMNGKKIGMNELPVPCDAKIVFQPVENSNPNAVKIIVNRVKSGASTAWMKPLPE